MSRFWITVIFPAAAAYTSIGFGIREVLETLVAGQGAYGIFTQAATSNAPARSGGFCSRTSDCWDRGGDRGFDADSSTREALPDTYTSRSGFVWQHPNCFDYGTEYHGSDIKIFEDGTISHPEACQDMCAQTPGCAHWTYVSETLGCYLKHEAVPERIIRRSSAISGPRACPSTYPFCYEVDTDYHGSDIGVFADHLVRSADECRLVCLAFPQCHYWTWVSSQRNCYLKNEHAPRGRVSVLGSISGPRQCVNISLPSFPECSDPNGQNCYKPELYDHVPLSAGIKNDVKTAASGPNECQSSCERHPTCTGFSYSPKENRCMLENSWSTALVHPHNVSSSKLSHSSDCSVEDVEYYGKSIGSETASSFAACHNLCQLNPLCSALTYHVGSLRCYLLQRAGYRRGFVSGPNFCMARDLERAETHAAATATKPASVSTYEDAVCYDNGMAYAGSSFSSQHVASADLCQTRCRRDPRCRCFTYFFLGKVCLMHDQEGLKVPNETAVSGPSDCLPSKLSCFYEDVEVYGKDVGTCTTEDVAACQEMCRFTASCSFFVYQIVSRFCVLRSHWGPAGGHRSASLACSLYDRAVPALNIVPDGLQKNQTGSNQDGQDEKATTLGKIDVGTRGPTKLYQGPLSSGAYPPGMKVNQDGDLIFPGFAASEVNLDSIKSVDSPGNLQPGLNNGRGRLPSNSNSPHITADKGWKRLPEEFGMPSALPHGEKTQNTSSVQSPGVKKRYKRLSSSGDSRSQIADITQGSGWQPPSHTNPQDGTLKGDERPVTSDQRTRDVQTNQSRKQASCESHEPFAVDIQKRPSQSSQLCGKSAGACTKRHSLGADTPDLSNHPPPEHNRVTELGDDNPGTSDTGRRRDLLGILQRDAKESLIQFPLDVDDRGVETVEDVGRRPHVGDPFKVFSDEGEEIFGFGVDLPHADAYGIPVEDVKDAWRPSSVARLLDSIGEGYGRQVPMNGESHDRHWEHGRRQALQETYQPDAKNQGKPLLLSSEKSQHNDAGTGAQPLQADLATRPSRKPHRPAADRTDSFGISDDGYRKRHSPEKRQPNAEKNESESRPSSDADVHDIKSVKGGWLRPQKADFFKAYPDDIGAPAGFDAGLPQTDAYRVRGKILLRSNPLRPPPYALLLQDTAKGYQRQAPPDGDRHKMQSPASRRQAPSLLHHSDPVKETRNSTLGIDIEENNADGGAGQGSMQADQRGGVYTTVASALVDIRGTTKDKYGGRDLHIVRQHGAEESGRESSAAADDLGSKAAEEAWRRARAVDPSNAYPDEREESVGSDVDIPPTDAYGSQGEDIHIENARRPPFHAGMLNGTVGGNGRQVPLDGVPRDIQSKSSLWQYPSENHQLEAVQEKKRSLPDSDTPRNTTNDDVGRQRLQSDLPYTPPREHSRLFPPVVAIDWESEGRNERRNPAGNQQLIAEETVRGCPSDNDFLGADSQANYVSGADVAAGGPRNTTSCVYAAASEKKVSETRNPCFVNGSYNDSVPVEETVADTTSECQRKCTENELCSFFSFFRDSGRCTLHLTEGNKMLKREAVSGPWKCTEKYRGENCFVLGAYSGNVLNGEGLPSSSVTECYLLCVAHRPCAFFTYDGRRRMCKLLETVQSLTSAMTSVSGPRHCATSEPNPCVQEGFQCEGQTAVVKTVSSLPACLTRCQGNPNCNFYSYDKSTNTCALLVDVGKYRRQELASCGAKHCFSPSFDPSCFYRNIIHVSQSTVVEARSLAECYRLCETHPTCKLFSFIRDEQKCHVHELRGTFVYREGALTGAPRCGMPFHAEQCVMRFSQYVGEISAVLNEVRTALECQSECAANALCNFFTHWTDMESCTLFKSRSGHLPNMHTTSGWQECPDHKTCASYKDLDVKYHASFPSTTADHDTCVAECVQRHDCTVAAYDSSTMECYTASLFEIVPGVVSGPLSCKAETSVMWTSLWGGQLPGEHFESAISAVSCLQSDSMSIGLSVERTLAKSPQNCQLLCQAHPSCRFFSYSWKDRICYLYETYLPTTPQAGFTSGPAWCTSAPLTCTVENIAVHGQHTLAEKTHSPEECVHVCKVEGSSTYYSYDTFNGTCTCGVHQRSAKQLAITFKACTQPRIQRAAASRLLRADAAATRF